jgi:hypothetical protein
MILTQGMIHFIEKKITILQKHGILYTAYALYGLLPYQTLSNRAN